MAASNLAELPSWAGELLESTRVARLGLLDDERHPRVLPVTFAVAERALWSAVDEKPKRNGELARVRYLRQDPHAAITVDRYSDHWDELAWVQVLGEITVIDARAGQAAAGLAALATKYEPYREALPPGPLLRLDPRRCLYWSARTG